MKRVKKYIALLLAVAMTMSLMTVGNVGVKTVKAEEIFAITSPTNGQLKAAGYIDIDWTSATSEGAVTSYSVFINGKEVAKTTSNTYEYYTTKVNYHIVWIRANYANGKYAFTSSVRFGITKKGLGLSANMGRSLSLSYMNLGWYYNWSETPSTESQYTGIEFVPMVWKETNANNLKRRVQSAKDKGYKYILTFNEPDLKGQCDMAMNDVYNVWKGISGMEGIKISSPVTAQWPSNSPKWFQPFMTKVDENGDYKPDFISIHCYPNGWGGAGMAEWFLTDIVDWTWEKYGLPIWVTEFSTEGADVSETGGNGTKEFWEAVMPGLDEREYVERYAAFGFDCRDDKDVGLWWYTNGALSPGGDVYRLLGNPTTDLVEGSAVNPGATQKGNLVGYEGGTNNTSLATGKIKKLKNVSGKKVKVKIKKVTGADGYQIRYCDNRKFNGYIVKNTKKVKVTIKKLDLGTKYFFKVRAYTKNGSKKVWGKWSNVKKVKIRK